MSPILRVNSKKVDGYGVQLLISMMILIVVLTYSSFYLMQNYFAKSFLEFNLSGKKVYFLQSNTVKKMYEKNGMDYEAYRKRVEYFKNLCLKNSYKSLDVYSGDLAGLDKNSKLIALDMMSLSAKEINDIDKFVSRGGRIIFNYTSGFLDTRLRYQKKNLVTKITGLSLDKKINNITYDRNSTAFISTKLLSPITKYLPKGKTLDLALYDPLPIFDAPKNLDVDAYMTTWTQVNYMSLPKKGELTKAQSALVCHGYKKKGKWVYFSFPSYVFVEVSPSRFANLFKGMLEYLDKSIIALPYPYIDTKNIVFVSEDTEYKFENLQKFHDVAEKNHFPVTAFCVANLAQKHKEMMHEVGKSKYVEIGSHSYTHGKIVGKSDAVYEKETIGSKKALYALTKQEVYGFRPPREEIDDKMIKLLGQGGFNYILNKSESRLTPYFMDKIMIIPRHGTDDYSYLINLDWDSSKILKEMEHEVNVVADLNGIYTLSTHTHLMSFGSNINITDKFFQYINAHKRFKPMNGKMLYDRVSQKSKITLKTKVTMKKLLMTITNNNNVSIKNIHYEIDVDSAIKITDVGCEIVGVKTKLIKVNKNRYTLIVEKMKPLSQLLVFVNYEKNN